MKTMLLTVALVSICSIGAYAQTADTALVQAAIDAYNNKDTAYFDKTLAADVVWLDEDGHAIAGKERVSRFLGRQLSPGARKLTTSDVSISSAGDVAWARFTYTIEADGKKPIKGLNSVVYRRTNGAWQIVMVHGSINAPSPNHP